MNPSGFNVWIKGWNLIPLVSIILRVLGWVELIIGNLYNSANVFNVSTKSKKLFEVTFSSLCADTKKYLPDSSPNLFNISELLISDFLFINTSYIGLPVLMIRSAGIPSFNKYSLAMEL